MEVVIGVISAALAALGFLAVRRQAISREMTWGRAASALGLRFQRGRIIGSPAITGKMGALSVRVETFEKPTSGDTTETWTRVSVAGDRIPRELELRRERGWSGLKKVFTGEDVQTADLEFDGAVHVAGPEEVAVALLGDEARAAVLTLTQELQGIVKDGCVQLERKGALQGEGEIGKVVRALSAVASLLALDSVPSALGANAKKDRVLATRLRNLNLLLDKFAGTKELERAIETALIDPAAELRLFAAARVSGVRARPVLAALVEDRAVNEEVRAAALEKLLAKVGYPAAAPSVAAALAARDDRLRRAALLAIAAAGDASFLERVIALAAGAFGPVAEAAAVALGRFGDARAEVALLQLLGRDAVEVKRAAARALGSIGTVRAVEPLLAATRGLLADARCKEAAREAVLKIQGRLGEAGAGQLSLAEHADAVGNLSVAPGGGELAIAPPDKAGKSS